MAASIWKGVRLDHPDTLSISKRARCGHRWGAKRQPAGLSQRAAASIQRMARCEPAERTRLLLEGDLDLQTGRPFLVLVGVVQVRAAGRASVRAGDGGNQAQRDAVGLLLLEGPPVQHDIAAEDFVGIDLAGLDQLLELVVPYLQAA